MTPSQRTEALRLADILGRFPTDQPRRDAAALLRTLAAEPQFPPDYPDGPDREPAAEPDDFDAWQANPYTKVLQDSIANDYVPKHSSEPQGGSEPRVDPLVKARDEAWARKQAQEPERLSNAPDNGWLEAAIAWEVCASLHREYAKGKDALFTTRQADFVKHANNARTIAAEPVDEPTVDYVDQNTGAKVIVHKEVQ